MSIAGREEIQSRIIQGSSIYREGETMQENEKGKSEFANNLHLRIIFWMMMMIVAVKVYEFQVFVHYSDPILYSYKSDKN